ncbi:zeaxanthin epoxidase, chloroplastic [Podospora conica]|nr:zeaxanthin epoxidase, chloroplastic [Schizothecium conicum]
MPSPSPPPTQKPILLSGAGPASLLLAQSLRAANLPFLLLERDPSLASRAQGYRLRLSADGLDAIESVLDPDHFARFWARCGKTGGMGFTAYDAVSGRETAHGVAEELASRGGKVVGVARGGLRRVFAEGVEGGVEFGRVVVGYELSGDGEGVRAVFEDGGRSVEGCLLVGGEGVHSRVARQVSQGRLRVFDTGARGIHGQAPSGAFKGLGEGVFRIRDAGREEGAVFVITNVRPGEREDPEVKFGWTMGGQPGVIRAPNDDYSIVGREAAEMARGLTRGWHERFRPLFEQMEEGEAAFWKITCSSPSGVPEWENEPRVTVIGDAVHSMTPAGGIGANTAVRDAALLGRLLREAGGWAPGVTAAYEKEMRVYASEAVRQSYAMAVAHFGIEIDESKSKTV